MSTVASREASNNKSNLTFNLAKFLKMPPRQNTSKARSRKSHAGNDLRKTKSHMSSGYSGYSTAASTLSLGSHPSRATSSGSHPSRATSSGSHPSRGTSSGSHPSRATSSGSHPSRGTSSGSHPSRATSSGSHPSSTTSLSSKWLSSAGTSSMNLESFTRAKTNSSEIWKTTPSTPSSPGSSPHSVTFAAEVKRTERKSFCHYFHDNTVTLRVYDLSNGMASVWWKRLCGEGSSPMGIWHTAIEYNGYLYQYMGGNAIKCRAEWFDGCSCLGEVVATHNLGVTTVTEAQLVHYVETISPQYTATTYHLINRNCNHFTDDLCQFLLGRSIPQYIIDTPANVQSCILGRIVVYFAMKFNDSQSFQTDVGGSAQTTNSPVETV